MRMSGREEYKVRLSLAGKYRIGLNIIRAGKIGVKGLFLEYGEYSAKYSPTVNIDVAFKHKRIFAYNVVLNKLTNITVWYVLCKA